MGNINVHPPYTEEQKLGLLLSQTLASIASMIGAAYIVQHIARSPKRRQRVAKRIILGMSLMDLLKSCVTSVGSTVVPKEMRPMIPFASGSWAICETAGFLNNAFTMASVLYNATLTLYYLLTIRYGWTETRVKGLEIYVFHLVPLVMGLVASTAALEMDLYNPSLVGCHLREFPPGCHEIQQLTCIRGENVRVYRIVLGHFWVWLVFIFLVFAMTLIYQKIAKEANRGNAGSSTISGDAYNPNSNNRIPTSRRDVVGEENHHSSTTAITTVRGEKLDALRRQFAFQALLYCIAFAMTWFFLTLLRILKNDFGQPTNIPLVFLSTIFSALQGFWNFFIYVRPRYLRYRREQREERERQRATAGRAQGSIQALVAALSVNAEDEEDTFQVATENVEDVMG